MITARHIKLIFTCILTSALFMNCVKGQNEGLKTPGEFQDPQNYKVHTWWHWIDGNITEEGITRDLEAMCEQGISQATILNVGVSGKQYSGTTEIKFDTPEWYAMFSHALKEAERLGIILGVHNCDGWSTTGGPWITPGYAMKEISWSKCLVKGGGTVKTRLPEPYSMEGFYRDVAILALKTDKGENSFVGAEPVIMLNGNEEISCMYDGCPVGGAKVEKGDSLSIQFREAFEAEKITIHPRKTYIWGNLSRIDSTYVHFTLLAADSDGNYIKVLDFKTRGFNKTLSTSIPRTVSKSYKLIVNDFKHTDDFFIGELELLKEGEAPQYHTGIMHHQIKTASVQGSSDEQFFTVSGERDTRGAIRAEDIVDLTDHMNPGGVLEWDAPAGDWEIFRFGYTLTGKKNHPATENGVGLECDKLDAAALDLHFSHFPQRLIEQAGKYTGNTFKFLLADSWECFFQNWTKAFPGEFESLNGYPITKWLPVLCGEIVENKKSSESFLFDFRRTIAMLIENNYYKHFAGLCHRKGLELHGEVIYGGCKLPPLDVLKAYSYTDMPMFEYWARQDKNVLFNYRPVKSPLLQYASSAGLFYGKPVVGSEAYTGYATYSTTPGGLKPFGDMAYCSGINQMILHSYVHQPGDDNPGITLRNYGQPFNRLNTYWDYLSGWMAYQARMQYMLQDTRECTDILFYVGDHLPQLMADLDAVPRGYSSNICNYDILQNKLYAENHKIVSSEGASFSILVLPEQDGISFATLLRLEELVKQGGVLYGEKPAYLYSLSEERKYQDDFEKLAQKIWSGEGEDGLNMVEYGEGKVLWGGSLADALNYLKLPADFSSGPSDTTNFLFTHKQDAGSDIYLVFNQLDQAVSTTCEFRVEGKVPEIWDAMTGDIVPASEYRAGGNTCSVFRSFKPRESVFFVFRDTADNTSKERKDEIIDEYEITGFDGSVEFFPAYEQDIGPEVIHELKSLSEFESREVKYFAGEAKYRIRFQYDQPVEASRRFYLNLGEVSAGAHASLNGKDLGVVWSSCQEPEVGDLLKEGENILEVTVAVPYRNRFIGDFKEYGEVRSLWTTCEIGKYLNADTPLMQTGWTGPVKIIAGGEALNKRDEIQKGWLFRQVGEEEWMNAEVPGCVHTDLIANGKIPDPFYRLNEHELQWIDKKDWEYKTTIEVSPELLLHDRIEIDFKGLDTYAQVFINEVSVLDADNMFREWAVDIKRHLKEGENELRIIFRSPINEGIKKYDAQGFVLPGSDNDLAKIGKVESGKKVSPYTRKAGYHFGWDWGPRLVTSGIWRPVYLHAWDLAKIDNLQLIQNHVSQARAELTAVFEIESAGEVSADISILSDGQLWALRTIALKEGIHTYSVDFSIENPELWWTRGLGEAHLYNIRGKLNIAGREATLDTRVGIRSIELVREKDSGGTSFYFRVNGIPVFMKGANYIPNDVFLPRVTKEMYQNVIATARESNFNMLRVWGGGIYEDDIFYELCDESGILVWQDFMFACAMYPGGDAFLENIKQEAIDNVKRLRNHPSIGLWCGNNEILRGWYYGGWKKEEEIKNKENADEIWKAYEDIFHKILPEVVSQYDESADYWSSSPSSGTGIPADLVNGDEHYWGVWWGKEPFETYGTFIARFMSEYGFQSFPELKTVKQYALPEDYDIFSEVMKSHQRSSIGNGTIEYYMLREYEMPKDFESFLYVNQVLQAEGIKFALEGHRRAMPYCMGSLYWQINDCWPVASWSSTDYYQRWKALQYYAKKGFEPVLVSPYMDGDHLKVDVVNDHLEPIEGELHLKLIDFEGTILREDVKSIHIPANSSTNHFSSLKEDFLKGKDARKLLLVTTLNKIDEIIAGNEMYFLPFKELSILKPELEYDILPGNDGFLINIKTDKLAKNVLLEIGQEEGFFSDNYFDLLPGQRKVVHLRSSSSIDILKEELSVRTLDGAF